MDNTHQFIDLLITEGGIELDDGQQPYYTENTPSIAQDIKHTIMESGLARKLLGERSRAQRAAVLTEIELLIEHDSRLEAGTIWISESSTESFVLTAQVRDGDGINLVLDTASLNASGVIA